MATSIAWSPLLRALANSRARELILCECVCVCALRACRWAPFAPRDFLFARCGGPPHKVCKYATVFSARISPLRGSRFRISLSAQFLHNSAKENLKKIAPIARSRREAANRINRLWSYPPGWGQQKTIHKSVHQLFVRTRRCLRCRRRSLFPYVDCVMRLLLYYVFFPLRYLKDRAFLS